MRRVVLLAVVVGSAMACTSEPGVSLDASTSADAEPASTDASSEGTDLCESVPVLSWATFGEGFFLDSCQSCHASGAADRHGAPADVVFDTLEDVIAWRDRIAARAGSELGGMPPAGGVSEVDRELLLAWLRCSLR